MDTGSQRVFDAHLHIIDPAHPLVENDGFLPAPFTAADYRMSVSDLTGFDVQGGAVISGSFQAFDQGYLVAALSMLGPTYVGVTQLPASVSDGEILALDGAGVRAVRFNLRRGGSAGVEDLEQLARRVHEVAGWHSELYVDARSVDELSDVLLRLPAVSIDHLGLHADGLPQLLRLVAGGVKVKATGFGRVEMDPSVAMRAVLDVDPTSLMVGTDLPSTRARRPFSPTDLDLVRDVAGDLTDDVMWGNAERLYLRRRAASSSPPRLSADGRGRVASAGSEAPGRRCAQQT